MWLAAKRWKRGEADARNARIDAVVDAYCKGIGMDAGFSGLIKANITSLELDNDVRELFDRIQLRGQSRPIRAYEQLFEDIDLLRFFWFVRREGIEFHKVSPEQAIERFKQVESNNWRR